MKCAGKKLCQVGLICVLFILAAAGCSQKAQHEVPIFENQTVKYSSTEVVFPNGSRPSADGVSLSVEDIDSSLYPSDDYLSDLYVLKIDTDQLPREAIELKIMTKERAEAVEMVITVPSSKTSGVPYTTEAVPCVYEEGGYVAEILPEWFIPYEVKPKKNGFFVTQAYADSENEFDWAANYESTMMQYAIREEARIEYEKQMARAQYQNEFFTIFYNDYRQEAVAKAVFDALNEARAFYALDIYDFRVPNDHINVYLEDLGESDGYYSVFKMVFVSIKINQQIDLNNIKKTCFHEYFHYMIDNQYSALPLWFEEACAVYMESFASQETPSVLYGVGDYIYKYGLVGVAYADSAQNYGYAMSSLLQYGVDREQSLRFVIELINAIEGGQQPETALMQRLGPSQDWLSEYYTALLTGQLTTEQSFMIYNHTTSKSGLKFINAKTIPISLKEMLAQSQRYMTKLSAYPTQLRFVKLSFSDAEMLTAPEGSAIVIDCSGATAMALFELAYNDKTYVISNIYESNGGQLVLPLNESGLKEKLLQNTTYVACVMNLDQTQKDELIEVSVYAVQAPEGPSLWDLEGDWGIESAEHYLMEKTGWSVTESSVIDTLAIQADDAANGTVTINGAAYPCSYDEETGSLTIIDTLQQTSYFFTVSMSDDGTRAYLEGSYAYLVATDFFSETNPNIVYVFRDGNGQNYKQLATELRAYKLLVGP